MDEKPHEIMQFQAGANPVSTGLVTAPVTTLPDGWTIHRVAALVRDLAQNMYELPYILNKHGLAQSQYDALEKNEFFKDALQAMTVEWNSAGNTQKRLALESAIGIEDALPAVIARLSKVNEPLPGVVALLKVLAEISGTVGNTAKRDDAPRERFKITINLGADVQQFEKTRPTIEISGDGQREGDHATSQPLLEAPGS